MTKNNFIGIMILAICDTLSTLKFDRKQQEKFFKLLSMNQTNLIKKHTKLKNEI